jgi:hypothetical protein
MKNDLALFIYADLLLHCIISAPKWSLLEMAPVGARLAYHSLCDEGRYVSLPCPKFVKILTRFQASYMKYFDRSSSISSIPDGN